jgi:hypothetical protein
MLFNIFSKFLGGGKKSSGSGGDRAASFMAALEADLNLDAGQKAAIEHALREFMQGKRAAKQAGNKDGVQAEKQAFRDADGGILNVDQLEKFTAKFQEYRQLLQ